MILFTVGFITGAAASFLVVGGIISYIVDQIYRP